MARRASIFALSALAVSMLVLAACRQEPKPGAEPVKTTPAAAAKPGAQTPIAQGAGMCGAEEPKVGAACGDTAVEGMCGSCEHEGESSCGAEGQADNGAPVVPATEAEVGDRTRCPVSHGIFTVRDSSPTLQWEGKTYRFCCPGCLNRFRQDPTRYSQS
jgi:YHS domain-containing protein